MIVQNNIPTGPENLVSFETARAILDQAINPVNAIEVLPIDDVAGRVLAQSIIAAHSTPPFDRAAVDGYAVKASDTAGASPESPKVLDIIETIHAGMLPSNNVVSGQSIQISTGAPMPVGADAMVMVEDTQKRGNQVAIFKFATAGDHVAPRGEDIQRGQTVLSEGTLLDAGKVGVLASQGLTRVKVYARPRVAIMPTGEEIADLGSVLKPGQIFDINSHTLKVIVQENGCVPVLLPVTGDSRSKLRNSLHQSLYCDMVVTSGGSSMGEKDLVMELLESMGQVLFRGINIKPGKPTTCGLVNNKPVVGMPGYPTSCLINAHVFLKPALRRMARLSESRGLIIEANLSEPATNHSLRKRFLPVKLENGKACSVFKTSGAITSTSQAEGYIIIPENAVLPQGTKVSVYLF